MFMENIIYSEVSQKYIHIFESVFTMKGDFQKLQEKTQLKMFLFFVSKEVKYMKCVKL